MEQRFEAEALAQRYIHASIELGGGPELDSARAAVATASPEMSDVIAEVYAERLLAGKGRTEICIVLANQVIPMWFPRGRDRIVAALDKIRAEEPRAEMCRMCLVRGQVRRNVEDAGLARRILSVFARAWVIGFVLVPVGFALLLLVVIPAARIPLAITIAVLLALAIFIDGSVRRCPSCTTLLAGMATGMKHAGSYQQHVGHGTKSRERTVASYSTLWQCAKCKHRWEK